MKLVLAFTCWALAATEPDHTRVEQDAMRRRMAEDRVKSQILLREESSILDGLAQIDQQLAARKDRLDALTERAQQLELSTAAARSREALARTELGALRAQIGRRARAMFRLTRASLVELVAHVTSPVEARQVRDRLRIVLQHDAAAVRRTRETENLASTLARDLRIEKTELDANRSATESELSGMGALRDERAALLEAVRSERRLTERLIVEIAAAAKKVDREAEIMRGVIPPPPLRPGGLARQMGRLPWPVAGRIEVPFGKRVDVASGMIMTHRGLDLRAPFGETVRAVFAGDVRYAAPLEGHGRVVLIDHDGAYTIYGHLDELEVTLGDRVEVGEPIGTVGDSDSDKGAFLYFELREGRRAVDPVIWLSP